MRDSMMDSLDVAYALGVAPEKVYAMCRQGEIPHVRVGNAYVFDGLKFRRWHREYKKRQIPTPSPPPAPTAAQIARMPTTGSVYFIQGVDGGPIKIGKANFPERRLYDLQASSPVRLRILATVAGGMRREYELHRQFKASRLHGEWFEPTPELLAEIEGHRGTD
jgi:hypothetical protein